MVPSTVPTTIVTRPISMLATSDSRRLTVLKNSSYHCRLKPEKSCSDGVELNENSATIASGAKVKNTNSQKNARRKRGGRSRVAAGVRSGAQMAAFQPTPQPCS